MIQIIALLKVAPFLRNWETEESGKCEKSEKRDGGWILRFGDNGQGYGNQPVTPWLQSHCLEQNPLQGLFIHILLLLKFQFFVLFFFIMFVCVSL